MEDNHNNLSQLDGFGKQTEYSGQDTTTKEVQTEVTKCDSCGANMVFDPITQKLFCPFCESQKAIVSGEAKELDIRQALFSGDAKISQNVHTFRCENCGACVTMELHAVALKCPFCGTSHIVEEQSQSGLIPNAVVPFSLDGKGAAEACKKWGRKRLFAPRKFKKTLTAENVRGVYTPCYTFDSATFSTYSGRLGKRRTRTVGSGKNRRTETYTEWFYVNGDIVLNFDDLTICAGSKFTEKQFRKLQPFPSFSASEYAPEYLSGFMAYGSDKDLQTGWDEARSNMDAQIRRAILRRYNADYVGTLNVSTQHANVTYKYVLVPVYIANYTFRQKLYNVFINGSSGKVYGKSPKSPLRIGLVALLIAAVCVGIYFLAGGL